MAKHNRYGKRAEWLVRFYYRLLGYRILHAPFTTKLGEIDIVAQKGTILACIEVKARHKAGAEIITQKNKKRCCDAARILLAKHPHYATYELRMDAAMVHRWRISRQCHAWECALY